MSNLKMTLLENSISFFSEAMASAIQAEKDSTKWKIALLLLVQAIETSLKERLRRTHELFLYSNIDNPKHTVNLNLAIDRLQRISKVVLEKADRNSIQTASDLRNNIVHFEFALSINQIKSNFVNLVGFYTSFCQDQLSHDVVSDLPSTLHSELLSLNSYIEELETRAKERIKKEGINPEDVWECPVCRKDTFVIYDGKDTCYLCSHHEELVECEKCNSLEFEEDLEDFDFGNLKGWENYKRLCKDCVSKIENQDPYDHYY